MSNARSVEHSNTVNVEKSLIDHRTYKYFELENGIKVIVISSLKPGEEPESMELDRETSSCDGMDSEDEQDTPEDDNNIDSATITDPNKQESYEANENKSAAALCITVGSLSDPVEAQGLSHFLEHMVFMGSEKYPNENDFDAFLSKRGGSTNAWTDSEHTLFYFDVKANHFSTCLDRFAQFFIHPLLQRGSVDREIDAVHSEFELAKARDSTHVENFLSTLVSSDSPLRLFGYGNHKSLKETPEKNGTDIYTLLQRHRETHYSASRMTLALQSKDTLDHMEQLVRQIFSPVPNSGIPAPEYSKFSASFDIPAFNRMHRICPIGDREKLRIVWALPTYRSLFDSHPLGVISSLVGHEGPGSLLALLKEKNWAVALSTGTCATSDSWSASFYSLYPVDITLTDVALDHVYEVCGIVFDYLKMLLALAELAVHTSRCSNHGDTETTDEGPGDAAKRVPHPTLASYLREFCSLRRAHFLYSEPPEATDAVANIASMLHLVPPDRVLSAYHVFRSPDLKLCVEWLKLLTPSRAAIIHLSSHFATSLKPESPLVQVEPWFGTRYTSEDIPSSVMQKWMSSKPGPELHLPYINIYLTDNFDLLSSVDDMKEPCDLNQTPAGIHRAQYGQLWFQQSTKFKAPKVGVFFHFWSPIVDRTPKNFALHNLLTYMLNLSLDTIAYEASEANFEYQLVSVESGICLSLTGFSQKVFRFYATVIDHLVDQYAAITEKQFDTYHEAVRRGFFNDCLKVSSLNSLFQTYLLRRNISLYEDLLSSFQSVSLPDLLAYKQQFFGKLRITAYVHGNVKAEEAVRLFDYTTEKLQGSPYSERKFSDHSVLQPGVYHLRVRNCNPKDVNMCLALVNLLGETDVRRDTINKLLAHLLSEPAFDYLRTNETLGYNVYLRSWRSFPGGSLHSGISVVACSQANHFSVGHVAGRLLAFWYRIGPRVLASMSPEAFRVAVDSLISLNQLEDPNMLSEVSRNWSEILQGEAMFNRRETRVKVLRAVTQEDLLDFYLTEYLDPTRRRSLFVEVDALPDAAKNCEPLSSKSIPFARVIPLTADLRQQVEASLASVNVPASVSNCLPACQAVTEDSAITGILEQRAAECRRAGVGSAGLLAKWGGGDEVGTRSPLEPLHLVENVHAFHAGLTFEPGRTVK